MAILMPRKVKYRKWHKGTSARVANRGTNLDFGEFGLKALDHKWVSARQIEAARRAIIRYLKKGGKLWIRIFPYKPITRKGVEVPMGGGKGGVDHYAYPVEPGKMLFELGGVDEKTAIEAFKKAGDKLPIKTKLVKR